MRTIYIHQNSFYNRPSTFHLAPSQYHLINLNMPIDYSKKITFTASYRYVAHWCQRKVTYVSLMLSQQRHRLAYCSAPSSLWFQHIGCLSSGFSPRAASCSLEVRSIIFHSTFPDTQPCQDFEISEDFRSSESSQICDIYRSVCGSPLLVSEARLSTFFYRLAFTKSEKMLPLKKTEVRWILSPNPKLVQEVNVSI